MFQFQLNKLSSLVCGVSAKMIQHFFNYFKFSRRLSYCFMKDFCLQIYFKWKREKKFDWNSSTAFERLKKKENCEMKMAIKSLYFLTLPFLLTFISKSVNEQNNVIKKPLKSTFASLFFGFWRFRKVFNLFCLLNQC